jgi:glucose/arabinose dehydrogenase
VIARSIISAFFVFLISCSFATTIHLERINLPPGFHISVFAEGVEGARSMAWNGKDTLYVGTRSAGNVYALVDSNGDYKSDKQFLIAKDLNMPNGIVYYNDDLYVAEVHRILKFSKIDSHKSQSPKPVVIYDKLPTESHHGWRYLNIGPDNKLYISIGAPCNICDEQGYAVIARLNLDGSGFEVIARGIRNSVGFTWHPETRQLWFTDNGRDWLGDDLPPDELNRLSGTGEHFGYPYCHGGFLLDPEFGKGKRCQDYTPPVQKLVPHAAALGLHIYAGKQFPTSYQGQIFIAEHGSWNRSKKTGYRVSLVRIEDNRAVAYEDFATGWLNGNSTWGRPVDIKSLPDGSLLVSDDEANVIYRIYYKK